MLLAEVRLTPSKPFKGFLSYWPIFNADLYFLAKNDFEKYKIVFLTVKKSAFFGR